MAMMNYSLNIEEKQELPWIFDIGKFSVCSVCFYIVILILG